MTHYTFDDIKAYLAHELNTTKDIIDANENRYYNRDKLRQKVIKYSKLL